MAGVLRAGVPTTLFSALYGDLATRLGTLSTSTAYSTAVRLDAVNAGIRQCNARWMLKPMVEEFTPAANETQYTLSSDFYLLDWVEWENETLTNSTPYVLRDYSLWNDGTYAKLVLPVTFPTTYTVRVYYFAQHSDLTDTASSPFYGPKVYAAFVVAYAEAHALRRVFDRERGFSSANYKDRIADCKAEYEQLAASAPKHRHPRYSPRGRVAWDELRTTVGGTEAPDAE